MPSTRLKRAQSHLRSEQDTMRSNPRDKTYRQPPRRTRPCVPGLRGIETLSDAAKTTRITIIADDIISAITQISEMRDSGVLRDRHTRQIENMIDTIGRTDGSYRRKLERQIKKREHSLRLLRKQHREEVLKLVATASHGVGRFRQGMQNLQEELSRVRIGLAKKEWQYLAAVARNQRTERSSEGKEADGG